VDFAIALISINAIIANGSEITENIKELIAINWWININEFLLNPAYLNFLAGLYHYCSGGTNMA